MSSKFRIGDRVRYITKDDISVPYGKAGTIEEINSLVAVVNFDGLGEYVVVCDELLSLEVINNTILFAKTKPDAIIPSKREEDGWYDIYACFDEESIVIPPHTVKLIPTGIASAFSSKYRISLGERGSNTKSNLKVSAGKIDSGYRGEYFVALHNDNDIPVEITKTIEDFERTEDFVRVPYSKAIAQFAVEIVPQVEISEITYEELLKIKSERGTGKLGSSGK